MYASLYKNVLRFVLKESNEGESQISHGTKFHRVGPAFKKARSPKDFLRVFGTWRSPSSSDLKETYWINILSFSQLYQKL
jgi:hypothetical protein